MASNPRLFYKHSGRFAPTAPLVMLLAGGATGLITGAVYGILDWLNPIVYVNLLATLGVGFAVGWVILKMARAQHVRNPMVVALCSVAAGVIAWYAAWVGWVLALSDWQVVLSRPDHLWFVANELTVEGVWGIGSSGDMVSGTPLKLVWLIEALMMIGVAAVYPTRAIAQMPYSESEKAWADYSEVLPPLQAIPKEEHKAFKQRLAEGDVACLMELPPVPQDASAATYYQLISTQPDGGGNEHFLTIRTIEHRVNKKGESDTVEQYVARNLIIDAESRELIKQMIVDAYPDIDEQPDDADITTQNDGEISETPKPTDDL